MLPNIDPKSEYVPLLKFYEDGSNSDIFFHFQGLDAYWLREKKEEVAIKINYAIKGQKGEEQKTFPFRSELVIFTAAEWLAFRFFISSKVCIKAKHNSSVPIFLIADMLNDFLISGEIF